MSLAATYGVGESLNAISRFVTRVRRGEPASHGQTPEVIAGWSGTETDERARCGHRRSARLDAETGHPTGATPPTPTGERTSAGPWPGACALLVHHGNVRALKVWC